MRVVAPDRTPGRPFRILICALTLLLAGCDESPRTWYWALQRARTLSQHSQIVLHPCLVSGLLGTFTLCGSASVPENRDGPAGRRIALYIVVVPANGPKPGADPVVPLDGGPGIAAATDEIADFVRGSWPTHDVVLIDQRGTGQSSPLACALYGDGREPGPFLGSRFPVEPVRTCRVTLGGRADLSQYTTAAAADDFDEVLGALGYRTVDLVGFSYGGRAALVFVRRHPARVRSMVLSSGATPTLTIPIPSAEAARLALEMVFTDCRADTLCNRAFPQPAAELDTVLARLARSPVHVAVPATRRWRTETVAWAREGFAEAIFGLLYDVAHARKIPYWVHQAYQGNFTAFAEETVRARQIAWRRNDYGLTLSVVCSEDAPFIDSAAASRALAQRPLGAPLLASVQAACNEWPHAPLPPDARAPVESSVPTLILSGERDPTGATQAAVVAAEHLPNSLQMVTPYYGHSELNTCLLGLITTFIERPNPAASDTSCVASPHVPPFAIESPR